MIEFESNGKMFFFLFCFAIVFVVHLVHLKTAFLSYGMLSFNIYVKGK